MPHVKVPSRPLVWPRVAVLALAGIAVAGCENSSRFDSNPYASNPPPPRQETTGSISQRPASRSAVVSQSLPAPSRPETVAANGSYGYASGAHGLGAYRPGTSDVTGSVATHPAPPPVPAGRWTWDGGQPVTVGNGETLDVVARKNGVPLSALMEVNGVTSASTIRPGQRLVIPRYVSGSAEQAAAPSPAPQVAENVHVVAPGESLIGIARKHGVTLTALAHVNNIQPYDKVSIGTRLNIPGGQKVAMRQAPAPKVAQPRTVPVEKVASVPVQNARVAKADVKADVQHEPDVTKTVEPEGGIPSFRWPVKGRIIAGFGQRPNGTQNDGINLAVPEGTPVKAADDGVVAYAGNELKGYGNLVLVRHSNGYVSAYANASQLMVKRGDAVKRGQIIAHAGQTGNVSSPQLHFEIRKGSTPVDPTKYLGGA
jgi:murein DD-endopeptidase MepM/ murein hydrolase activator NlpD